MYRAGIDSATVDRELFPDCRQHVSLSTVIKNKQNKQTLLGKTIFVSNL